MTISIKATRGNSGSGDPTSISGPTVIIKGATNTYTITDYDSFSVYEVTSSAGTVSRTNETITLMVATDEVNNTLQLTVSRDDNIVVKNIAIGAQVIATPNITSPASGSVDVSIPTSLLATAFTSYPTGADTHVSSDWRVKNTAGEIVWQSLSNTIDKTSITIPASNLAPGTQYFAEVRYNGNILGSSSYSPPVQFTTSVVFIVRPSITSPVSGATGVAATPTFIATAFATNPIGSDTHASSDWRLKNSLGAIIWSSIADATNKTSITLPTGVLAVSSQYTMEVRYNGNILQPSQWSPVVSFTTAATFAYDKYLWVGHQTFPLFTLYGQNIDTFTDITNSAVTPSSDTTGVAFSPDGIYAACVTDGAPYMKIYKRNGDILVPVAAPVTPPAGPATAISFSPDGTYLAVTHDVSPWFSVYKKTGDSFVKLANPSVLPTGECRSCAWSPDGNHLAIGGAAPSGLRVYRRSGDSFESYAPEQLGSGAIVQGVAFSPDGLYLCAAQTVAPRLVVYKRSGNVYKALTSPSQPTSAGQCCAWSADGVYLAVGTQTSNLYIYKRSGDALTLLSVLPNMGSILGVAFSSDGLKLAVAGVMSPFVNIFNRNADAFTKLANPAHLPEGPGYAVAFYPPLLGV